MKSRMILPVLLALLAISLLADSKKAEAIDVGISIGVGSHHRDRRVVEYRTVDPVYTTWYPDSGTTYVYSHSSPYYDHGYGYGYSNTRYVYTTESVGYDGWYGSGRTGRGGYYGDGRRYERRNRR